MSIYQCYPMFTNKDMPLWSLVNGWLILRLPHPACGCPGYMPTELYGKVVRFSLDPFDLVDFQDISTWSGHTQVTGAISDGNYIYLYSSSDTTILRMYWSFSETEVLSMSIPNGIIGGLAVQRSLYFYEYMDQYVAWSLWGVIQVVPQAGWGQVFDQLLSPTDDQS
eukprot:Skav235431  [mRNA]  locus=scaffold473:364762:372879:- [translate_table: standard]